MEFEFPDTGEGVTEGKFLEWEVSEGEKVEEDQIVGEAETDKAVVEIPAPSDGSVKELKASPGDKVSVGDVIMILDTEKTDTSEEQDEASTDEEERTEDIVEKSDYSRSSSENVLALPKVRKLAEEKGVSLEEIKTGERITEEDVLEAYGESHEDQKGTDRSSGNVDNVQASPSVRRLAREKGVDLSRVEGSGRGGRITRADLEDVDEGEDSSREVSGDTIRRPLSGLEKQVAERMEESKFTAPHVTHVEKIDVTQIDEIRDSQKDDVDAHLTYLPFIMKAAVEGLKEYPELNAELDSENDEVVLKDYYCFNIAVDTDRGLLVPKIKNVDSKSISDLAGEIEEVAEKAREDELGPDEMSTGSFTVTNIGAIGGESFTPIINYPQTAILGIGRISETAEVVEDEVVPRMTVKLSLSYDHRVIDGATAAKFINIVKENLEEPGKMLVNL